MWNRAEVKAKGKIGFRRNYWPCVLVGLVLSILGGGAATVNVNINNMNGETPWQSISQSVSWTFLGGAALVILLLVIFVLNVLEVGCRRFFLLNQLQPAEMKEMTYGFKHNYQNTVIAQFMVALFVSIGLLLFIVPGVILFYRYYMVPYILSEQPELSPKEVLAASKEMMEGNKWNTFVYNLSFLGWYILGACTLGILNLFYVNPYVYASDAELYLTLRAHEINKNSTQTDDLN